MAKQDFDFDSKEFIEHVRRSAVPGYVRASDLKTQAQTKIDTTTSISDTIETGEVVKKTKSMSVSQTDNSDLITEPVINNPATIVDEADDANETTKVPKINRVTRQNLKSLTSCKTREEFMQIFFSKVPTKGGAPITIEADTLKRAYRMCARSGDHKTCPTYLINNILKVALDAIEKDMDKWGVF